MSTETLSIIYPQILAMHVHGFTWETMVDVRQTQTSLPESGPLYLFIPPLDLSNSPPGCFTGVLRHVSIWGHLQGQNGLFNLFSPPYSLSLTKGKEVSTARDNVLQPCSGLGQKDLQPETPTYGTLLRTIHHVRYAASHSHVKSFMMFEWRQVHVMTCLDDLPSPHSEKGPWGTH